MLENQFNGGTLSRREMAEALVQYDAAMATARTPKYMFWSVIVAAISAVASAISAAFPLMRSGQRSSPYTPPRKPHRAALLVNRWLTGYIPP